MDGRTFPGLTFEWGDAPEEGTPSEAPSRPAEPHENDPYREAMGKAGRILARRAHSEQELRDKLGTRLNDAVGDVVVARLQQLGLVDDAAFARQWVEERAARKGRGVLAAELEAKGIDTEVIEGILSRFPEEHEEARARELAVKHLDKVAGKPLPRQAASILQMLLRRGFEPELAEAATQAVLPPKGWD